MVRGYLFGSKIKQMNGSCKLNLPRVDGRWFHTFSPTLLAPSLCFLTLIIALELLIKTKYEMLTIVLLALSV